jgi:N-acetylglucosamine kinase
MLSLIDEVFETAKETATGAVAEALAAATADGPPGSSAAGAGCVAALRSAGLAVSGCAEVSNQQGVRKQLLARRPSLVAQPEHVVVGNDTVGSVFTASPDGGLVVISGTGTMAEAFLADGKSFRCGGWGHMLGDEGGGYWTVHRALSAAFRADDGFDMDASVRPADPRAVIALAIKHLVRADKAALLTDFYGSGFKKSHIAAMAKPLAELARAGDAIALAAFEAAGTCLGGMVRTLAPRMTSSGSTTVTVVAVGSVWMAWDLLKEPFLKAAREPALRLMTPGEEGFVDGPRSSALASGAADPSSGSSAQVGRGFEGAIRVVRLLQSSAVGSAVAGAKQGCGIALPLDYTKTTVDLEEWLKCA